MLGNDEIIIICKKAIDTWGSAMQQVVAMEECSELIEAIENSRTMQFHNVEEEIADVEIMCLQLRLIYGPAKVDQERIAIINSPIEDLKSESINACANLIKSISKSIRDKNSRIYESIAKMEFICEQLRNVFDRNKIQEFKQAKFKRLKGVVW